MPFVEESGFGCYQGSAEGIADTVEKWFAEGSVLEQMRDSALTAARPDATLDIARDLADMVYARKEELKRKEGKVVAAAAA